jgi:23S rRNA pseudouridine1911/1915/1917 synthase
VLKGQAVELGPPSDAGASIHGIKIFHEDEHVLVVCKPAGLLTVATIHERERTALAYLLAQLRKRNRNEKLFAVHRLDKFVSGLLVFARSEAVKARLQAQFKKHTVKRRYWAIVEGRVVANQGVIRSYLVENRAARMHSTSDEQAGKLAVTHYRVLRRFAHVTSLEVRLETGRKNQIRVHLSEMGHPIAGDRTYGSSRDPLGRIGLHAFCLGFRHPVTGASMIFTTEPPSEFCRYLPAEQLEP